MSAPSPTTTFPYATQADVEAALGRPLDPNLDVTNLLNTSADLVLGYLNILVYQPPVPGTVTRVIGEMVANVINRPQTPPDPTDTAYEVGQFAYQIGPQSVGPWLTNSQQTRLSLYGSGGLIVTPLASEILGSDVWMSVEDSFDPYAGTDLSGYGTNCGDVIETYDPTTGS
jgi:hypothetical protein